jgi:hypothetical protein
MALIAAGKTIVSCSLRSSRSAYTLCAIAAQSVQFEGSRVHVTLYTCSFQWCRVRHPVIIQPSGRQRRIQDVSCTIAYGSCVKPVDPLRYL